MTPMEHVHTLNNGHKAREEERRYVIRSLLNAEREFRRGEMLPLTALDEVDAELGQDLRS